METVISGSRAKVLWGTQRYFPLKKNLSNTIDLFVSVGLLVAVLKFNAQTVRNGIHKHRHEGSYYWSFFIDVCSILINWATIPVKSKNKLGLPIDASEMLAVLRANDKVSEEQFKSLEAQQIKSVLEDHYQNRWAPYLKYYEDDYPVIKERIPFAQMHSLFLEVLKMKDEKWPRAMIFDAYRQILIEEITKGIDPVFNSSNADYFWRKINEAKTTPIPKLLISESKGVAREYKAKVTGQMRAYILTKLRSPKNYTYKTIIGMVNEKFKVNVKEGIIKKMMSRKIPGNQLTRNLVHWESDGIATSRINRMPKVERQLASAPGEMYVGDFYHLQFIVRSEAGEIIRLLSYFVVDSYSGKAVGWAFGPADQEDKEQIAIDAFRMAFVENCFMPALIATDNDPLYGDKFQSFRRKVMNLGVMWPPNPPHYPLYRAEVENTFARWQKCVCSSKDFYLGESIRSKNKAGNPAQDLVKTYWKQKNKLPYISAFRQNFSGMVNELNTKNYAAAA